MAETRENSIHCSAAWQLIPSLFREQALTASPRTGLVAPRTRKGTRRSTGQGWRGTLKRTLGKGGRRGAVVPGAGGDGRRRGAGRQRVARLFLLPGRGHRQRERALVMAAGIFHQRLDAGFHLRVGRKHV